MSLYSHDSKSLEHINFTSCPLPNSKIVGSEATKFSLARWDDTGDRPPFSLIACGSRSRMLTGTRVPRPAFACT